MARVYVGIGSNVAPAAHVRAGVADLRARYPNLVVSPVYESPAVGFDGANFYNLVAAFHTDEDAVTLDQVLHAIERNHGRTPDSAGFVPRTLDLDLLLYDDRIQSKPPLPRPDILRYAFVLKPLVDIAGEARHPVTGQTYAEHWRSFDGECDLHVVDLGL